MQLPNLHLFKSLVDLTGDAVFIISVHPNEHEFFMEYVNAAYLKKFKLKEEEILGKELEQFLPVFNLELIRSRFTFCVRNKISISYEEIISIDGKIATSLSEIFPITDLDGVVNYVVGVSKDISELKRQRDLLSESESTLQSIINSSENIMIFVGPDLRLIYANAAAQRHGLRLIGREYQIGENIIHTLDKPEEQIAMQHVQRLLEGGQGFDFEHFFVYPDGKEVWFQRRYYPAYDTKGTYIGFVVASTDVSKQKENLLQIQRQADQLREIAKMQSHETRRPLANIIGLVDLIDLSKPLEETQEMVDMLRESTRQLDELIIRIVQKTHHTES